MNLYTEFVSDLPRYFTDTAYLCGTEATGLIRHTPFYTGQCLNLGNSIHANFFALHSTEQTLNIVCVVTVSKRGCCGVLYLELSETPGGLSLCASGLTCPLKRCHYIHSIQVSEPTVKTVYTKLKHRK